MMKLWMRERDQLIEQTMAFVEGVTAARPARAEPKSEPKAVKPAEAPKFVGSSASERVEIERRVASFKANQQKFQREREAHYDAIFSKTRTSPGNLLRS